MTRIDGSKLILEPYQPLLIDIMLNRHNHYFIRGGRASGKTMFSALTCILYLIADPNSNALCLRNDFAHLRKSVYNEIKKALSFIDQMHGLQMSKAYETKFDGYTGDKAVEKYNEYTVESTFKSKLQPLEIINEDTGQVITFAGASEPDKIKGLASSQSNRYYGFIWFDEFQEVNQGVDKALNIRATCERGDAKHAVSLYTYNPPPDPRHWINQSLSKFFVKSKTWHKNYNDLPDGILSKGIIEQAEHLRVEDNARYRNMYLGEAVGLPEGLVFHNKFEVEEFETPTVSNMYMQRPFFGVDWGFNDATTMIKSFAKDGYLFISDEIYLKKQLPEEIADSFKQMNGLFEGTGHYNIICDSSNPTMIADCENRGFWNINPAKKGKDSVISGISYLKLFKKIVIHPRCKNTIDEFSNYRYAEDKITGKYLPKIKDNQGDHCIDALRYSWEDMMLSNMHPNTNYA